MRVDGSDRRQYQFLRAILLVTCGCSCLLESRSIAAGEIDLVVTKAAAQLPPGKELNFKFALPRKENVSLSVSFSRADFSGATILASVNERAFLPYHAFGGDTRYDNVKGKAGLHPPVAKLEANYVIVAGWCRKGANSLRISNAGPGAATISSIRVRGVSGHDLPRYENSIYFDFDVWRQGLVLRPGLNWYLDSMLLGVLNGSGNYVMNFTGNNVMALKKGAEEARVGWGFRHAHFYSIWHLANNPTTWANYIDVDNDKNTTGSFHSQFCWPKFTPKGADIVLMEPEKLFGVLKPGIDGLLAYSTYYNLTCEQVGPSGQGFGADGMTWAKEGYDLKAWADNYQTVYGKLGKYIRDRNPEAMVLSTQWWYPDVRVLLYDTSLTRGFKMRDMIDCMMTHYYTFPYVDFDKNGEITRTDVHPELQYPGGKFEKPDPRKSRCYMGYWGQIPEIAIDFNRYRLSRTEKDMKYGDPEMNRWSDGRPFRYTAGFDGDEGAYNNETCVYDRNYSGPAPYQFLYAMFAYSLLPTGENEPKEFSITRTAPLYAYGPRGHDIFTRTAVPINRYGEWVEGAAHTHRLKTEDPLYGGMFGYTGFEYGCTGDYIMLGGIKERHHRREPFNAYNLVRRTCYSFVTSGRVFPAIVNNSDTNALIVKALVLEQDWREIVGLYAVNFDGEPHTLDVTLPVGWKGRVVAQVFDEKAADWSDAEEREIKVGRNGIRCKAVIPAASPWCMFIYPPTGGTHAWAGAPSTPQPLSPWKDRDVAGKKVTLRWRPSETANGKAEAAVTYAVELGGEMLFRPVDMVLARDGIEAAELAIDAKKKLKAGERYHWRVRAVDDAGRSSGWSRPHSFRYGSPPAAGAQKDDAPVLEVKPPRAEPLPDLKPFTDADNLAHTGMPFSHPNFWEGAGEAVDCFAQSHWISDASDRQPVIPGWWAVRFDREQEVSEIRLLWAEEMIGEDYDIQTWDGKKWQTTKIVRANSAKLSSVSLDAPVRTGAVRIWIIAAKKKHVAIAEVYIR